MLVGKSLLAAVSAAALVFPANLLLSKAGPAGIALAGPVLEEGIKTGSSLFFGAPVPAAHLLFGVLEAAGDLAWGGRNKLPAALCGVAAHTIFGLTTYLLAGSGFPVYTAVAGAVAVHVAWNTTVIRISG